MCAGLLTWQGAFYFSGDFLAEIVQKPYFDTRLNALEGKSGVLCLAAFFICAGSALLTYLTKWPGEHIWAILGLSLVSK